MLEEEVVEEIRELMIAMRLPYVALVVGSDKEYFSRERICDIPFEMKYQLLDDMKETYEKLNKEPWYSDCGE